MRVLPEGWKKDRPVTVGNADHVAHMIAHGLFPRPVYGTLSAHIILLSADKRGLHRTCDLVSHLGREIEPLDRGQGLILLRSERRLRARSWRWVPGGRGCRISAPWGLRERSSHPAWRNTIRSTVPDSSRSFKRPMMASLISWSVLAAERWTTH